MSEQITEAAILDSSGHVWYVSPPGRHGDVLAVMKRCRLSVLEVGDQGFRTSTGRFVSRREAKVVAKQAYQLLDDHNTTDELYSEDVW